jgi:hypothetical protein
MVHERTNLSRIYIEKLDNSYLLGKSGQVKSDIIIE